MSSNAKIFKTRSGNLSCPRCKSTNIKKIEMIRYGLYSRWECRECKQTFRYDETPPISAIELKMDKRARELSNPYRSFDRGLKK